LAGCQPACVVLPTTHHYPQAKPEPALGVRCGHPCVTVALHVPAEAPEPVSVVFGFISGSLLPGPARDSIKPSDPRLGEAAPPPLEPPVAHPPPEGEAIRHVVLRHARVTATPGVRPEPPEGSDEGVLQRIPTPTRQRLEKAHPLRCQRALSVHTALPPHPLTETEVPQPTMLGHTSMAMAVNVLTQQLESLGKVVGCRRA
jgi:hypothetical protein